MKKLAALFFMIIAFSVSASAQELSKELASKVQNDMTVLTAQIKLTEAQKAEVTKAFVMKHQNLAVKDLSDGRKKELARVVEHYLKAPLTPSQLEQLNAQPDLVNRLTH
ncbi:MULTISPECIES: hypothetical protein [unclassified Flavobacterium]|uniref:hypothetical protein n=1 Tax=unclassified Flavobacterium TaxID=196869 RepID=UPI00086F4619|nr:MULTISPECIES: hypothetical protein [unclassified Flavobacterium]MBN9283268.1 hypothetical protein [Flavobacterium sp.]ODS81991.1 MAG: hypothetical protein ABS44_18685 [Chryseobacterium sp. SCN 40-13]OJV70036.1 MAG: hypothetical protein BGO42_11295 [Flavobacterium sp. 40-81]